MKWIDGLNKLEFFVKFLEDKGNIRDTSKLMYVLLYTINFPAKGIIDLKLKVLLDPRVSVDLSTI